MATQIDPSTLVGLRCWLRPGVGVDTASGAVTTWRDQSGNGNDLPALGAANTRPAYQSDAGDGRPAVYFDGSNDYLGPALDVITSAGKAYTFVVTVKAASGNGGAQAANVGGGAFGGGSASNLLFGIDEANGQVTVVPQDDAGNNNTSIFRFYGTADFQTLFFRQDYFGPAQNFFLWSQDFSNAAWSKNAGATVEQNVAGSLAPDGTQTVAVLHSTGASYLQQNGIVPSMAASRVYDASVWAKADRRLPALNLATNAHSALVTAHSSFNIGSGSFVLALWYKPSSVAAGTHVILEYPENNYQNGILFNQFGADLYIYLNSGGPRFSIIGGLTASKWHRIVFVGDTNAQSISAYVNGVLAGTASLASWNVTATGNLRLGASTDAPATAPGFYRDLVICKASQPGFVVPTLGDVVADFNRTADFSGISARFPINEASGTSILASVGGAGPGTVSGGAGRQTGMGLSLTVGDGNDGNPTFGPANLSIDTSWQRLEIQYGSTGASSTNIALLITLTGAEEEVQLWGGQLTRSDFAIDYTPTTSAQIGTDVQVGTYPGGVRLRGGGDTADSSDNAPYNSQNATGRAFALAAFPYWDGSVVTVSPTSFKGWVRDVLLFDRALTDDEVAGVYSFLLNAPEDSAPTVSNVAPTPGSAISRSDPVFFDVTDDRASIRRALIAARFADGSYEVVHDGESFAAGYASLSSRESITNGFRYRVRRAAGWPSGPTIVPFVVDTSGQENA